LADCERADAQSPPLEQDEHLALWVPAPVLCGLRRRAAQKGISEAALAAMLLKTIVEDDLYEAVLKNQ
jgi:hypothetical protein